MITVPVSRDSIRAETDIRKTPKDKGLMMTIVVRAYDTGIIQVDKRVIDRPDGWLGAAEVVMQKLAELRHQEAPRLDSRDH
jgi:protein gp37